MPHNQRVRQVGNQAPVHPVRVSHFDNSLVVNHHSTTCSNDGTRLVLDDEVYTGVCAGGTGEPVGALWFYTSRILALLRNAVVDFTDPGHPREIASWVSSDLDGEHFVAYAGYWYNGHVYAENTARQGDDEPVTNRGFECVRGRSPGVEEGDPPPPYERADTGAPPGTFGAAVSR
jgi:hypothetical protein